MANATHWRRRLAAALLPAALVLSLCPAVLAQGPEELTRGQVRDALLAAADDYAPHVTAEDILRGDETGALHLERTATRAEALVMLERAFGGLPTPVGNSARTAFPAETFTDVPAWAQEELAGVFDAGIVAGTGAGLLSPEAPVTREELDTLIRRVYALEGSVLKDDFYAAVNKEWLDSSTIPPGEMVNGTLDGLVYEIDDQVAALIADIAAAPQEPGTPEAKIAALYRTVLDIEGQNKAGAEPIRKYLDAIDAAGSADDLVAADAALRRDLAFSTLLYFDLAPDLKDSSRYTVGFGTFNPALDKDFYAAPDPAMTEAYLTYLATLFTLSGESEADARADAQRVYDTEAAVSAASLDLQDQDNVDLIYNLYTLEELQEFFPQVDLEQVYDATGLKREETIVVPDVDAAQAAAACFTDECLADLKAISKINLVRAVSGTLGQDFQEAEYTFMSAYYGIEGRQSAERVAAAQVQSLLSNYLSRAYAEAHFTPEAKADVEEMVSEFISVYKERIMAQDWMSEETKAMAVKKLDTMEVKVGYPDSWETWLDDAEISAPEEGGTFFSNLISIRRASADNLLSCQGAPVDKTMWVLPVYDVNACYTYSFNDITFPAAILQAPMYDVNASREENLGGIGYAIAHEITHAFDNAGAKFDENGNAADWWTAEDYAAFQEKCESVVAWYDGQEVAPGISCSGALTLSENVADLGALRCVVEVASREEDPDYETLFRSMAWAWASTANRSALEFQTATDVHAPAKLRVNRALQTIPEFYETFDIRPGDGMWTDPESRASVW